MSAGGHGEGGGAPRDGQAACASEDEYVFEGGGAPKPYLDPAAGVMVVYAAPPPMLSPQPPGAEEEEVPRHSWDLPWPPPTAPVEEPRIIHEFLHTSNQWTEPRKLELAIAGSGESVADPIRHVVRFAGGAWHGNWCVWEHRLLVDWLCEGKDEMLPREPRTNLPIPGTSQYSRGCRDPGSKWYEVLHPVVPQV